MNDFEYECPSCTNLVMLERSKTNKNILVGMCNNCKLEISILEEDWLQEDKEKFWKDDEYFETAEWR